MKHGIVLIVLAALFSAFTLMAQSVEKMVAKSIAARGGIEKIKAVESLRLTGQISFGPDTEGLLIVEMKRPGKLREELRLNRQTMIRTIDGHSAWVINPFAGKNDPEPLSGDELGNMMQPMSIGQWWITKRKAIRSSS